MVVVHSSDWNGRVCDSRFASHESFQYRHRHLPFVSIRHFASVSHLSFAFVSVMAFTERTESSSTIRKKSEMKHSGSMNIGRSLKQRSAPLAVMNGMENDRRLDDIEHHSVGWQDPPYGPKHSSIEVILAEAEQFDPYYLFVAYSD